MSHIRRPGLRPPPWAGHRARHRVLAAARVLTPVCLWWIEAAWGALAAALVITATASLAALVPRRSGTDPDRDHDRDGEPGERRP
ncbi:hypothetical protein [Streptomyces sp. NPDC050560]|uniref:hypothetical protein n=1 Tax=Streptomyces sp. NPDC050560 TaxID=3365630 RepID=UPI0037B76834